MGITRVAKQSLRMVADSHRSCYTTLEQWLSTLRMVMVFYKSDAASWRFRSPCRVDMVDGWKYVDSDGSLWWGSVSGVQPSLKLSVAFDLCKVITA